MTEPAVRCRSLPGTAASGTTASTAVLAERCAAAAAEVAGGGCSTARLGAAAEVLDTALDTVARWDPDLAQVPTTRDGAGDLLAALSAAGLRPADRRQLESALAALLTAAALALRAAPHPR